MIAPSCSRPTAERGRVQSASVPADEPRCHTSCAVTGRAACPAGQGKHARIWLLEPQSDSRS